MATKKGNNNKKRAAKKAVRTAKKHTGLAVALVIILIVIMALLIAGEYYFGWIGIFDSRDNRTPYKAGELEIHFLDLGNTSSGDCTLIDIGNTEILIDAGSTANSASTIVPYIKEYCEDETLEYVIATHADSDHIAAFVGTQSSLGVFDSFECETIIDFPLTNKTANSTQIYNSYIAKRTAEVEAGAKHYTALECYNEENGAKRTYSISENISFTILYHDYYVTNYDNNENNYSVCLLLTQGTQNYLFTGDLEKVGEKSLVENNPDLPKCKLFKAGHHGSATSSNDDLLELIQPDIVCVNCCVGDSYDFPRQDFIDRVAKYTDKVYVTMIDSKVGHNTMNGNIKVWSDGVDVTVAGSNNSTKLKDTAWFNANRTWPRNGVM